MKRALLVFSCSCTFDPSGAVALVDLDGWSAEAACVGEPNRLMAPRHPLYVGEWSCATADPETSDEGLDLLVRCSRDGQSVSFSQLCVPGPDQWSRVDLENGCVIELNCRFTAAL